MPVQIDVKQIDNSHPVSVAQYSLSEQMSLGGGPENGILNLECAWQ
jgi:hypothetical protein